MVFLFPLDLVIPGDAAWGSCCHLAVSLKTKPVLGIAGQRDGRTWDLDDIVELLDQQTVTP